LVEITQRHYFSSQDTRLDENVGIAIKNMGGREGKRVACGQSVMKRAKPRDALT